MIGKTANLNVMLRIAGEYSRSEATARTECCAEVDKECGWSDVIWSGSRLNFCQSSPGPRKSLGKFSFSKVNYVNHFQESDQISVLIDIPIVIDTFFLHDVHISVGRSCYINVFQWNKECCFLRHMELNSRFIVMSIDEVTVNRPEVGTGFSVIC